MIFASKILISIPYVLDPSPTFVPSQVLRPVRNECDILNFCGPRPRPKNIDQTKPHNLPLG